MYLTCEEQNKQFLKFEIQEKKTNICKLINI